MPSQKGLKEFIKVYKVGGIIAYGLVISSLLFNFYALTKKGFDPALLFIKSSISQFPGSMKTSVFFEHYIYELTNVIIGEPFSWITNAMPYLEDYEPFSDLVVEMDGYFEKEIKVAEDEDASLLPQTVAQSKNNQGINVENFKDYYYILKQYVTGDGDLDIDIDLLKQWNFYDLIQRPIALSESKGPKVLIFHTHIKEAYIGGATVADVGEALKKELEEKYGIEVLHLTDSFYSADNQSGYPDGSEYDRLDYTIPKVLEEHPSIDVVIDIHRDGLDGSKVVTEIDGKPTAKVMLVGGLCEHRNMNGEIVKKTALVNPYLEDNLAFSFQMQAQANVYYPGLMRKIYFKEYRYSLHMKPLSLLVELGANTNTSQEAMNAVPPLADILAKVVQKD